jgi:hypothetical protein
MPSDKEADHPYKSYKVFGRMLQISKVVWEVGKKVAPELERLVIRQQLSQMDKYSMLLRTIFQLPLVLKKLDSKGKQKEPLV